jgi:hypothetical protein
MRTPGMLLAHFFLPLNFPLSHPISRRMGGLGRGGGWCEDRISGVRVSLTFMYDLVFQLAALGSLWFMFIVHLIIISLTFLGCIREPSV